jgi:hypothetical protein
MRPTTAFDDNVFDFNALLHPGTVFDHPKDVLAHPSLSISEKRAILASWASDASAIASCPSLRAPAGLKAPVTIDEILEALCELDGGPRHPHQAAGPIVFVRRRGPWRPSATIRSISGGRRVLRVACHGSAQRRLEIFDPERLSQQYR